MPNAQITNVAGAFGASTTSSNQSTHVEAVAAAAITSKYVVALSTTEANVVTAATNQSIPSLVGVATGTGVAGSPVLVCVLGPCYGVAKDTTSNIAQFDPLTISVTNTGTLTNMTAGTAITQLKDLGQVVGIAMAAAVTAATTVDVWLVSKY